MSKDNKNRNFFELYSAGEVLAGAIYKYIEKWHNGAGSDNLALHTYLGFSKAEYALWVKDAKALPHILKARQKEQSATRLRRSHFSSIASTH